jgi:transcription initiation factor TFIIB
MPIADPLTYVSKIAEKNGISGKAQGAAIAILREARRKRAAAGKDPMGLAAAALYIACLQHNEKKTQKDIADAAGVTEVTVRNRYKALQKATSITRLTDCFNFFFSRSFQDFQDNQPLCWSFTEV